MLSGCFCSHLFIDGGGCLIYFFFFLLLKVVRVLLGIAFVTLFERKILSFSQLRLGPNKLFLKGVFQPVFDGVKLLLKESVFPWKTFFWGMLVGPFLGFSVMLFLWVVLPRQMSFNLTPLLVLLIILFVGLSVYTTLLSG